MKKHTKFLLTVLSTFAILLSCLLVNATDERVEITILQTSDIHGMINCYDYKKNHATKYGLSRIAAIVREARRSDRELLLIDCGDLTVGNYIENFRNETPHPAIKALNFLEYDIFTVGNHEFNFEFSALQNALSGFEGTALGGNIYKSDGTRFLSAYKIFTVKGVKVAIFGVTAPHIPFWERKSKENYNGMRFTEPTDEIGIILDEIGDSADVIVGNVHYGLEGSYESLGVSEIAKKYADRIDALFIGHTHKAVNTTIYNIPVLQPASAGKFVSQLTLTLENKNGWEIVPDKTVAKLIPAEDFTPDRQFELHFLPLHEKSLSLF